MEFQSKETHVGKRCVNNTWRVVRYGTTVTCTYRIGLLIFIEIFTHMNSTDQLFVPTKLSQNHAKYHKKINARPHPPIYEHKLTNMSYFQWFNLMSINIQRVNKLSATLNNTQQLRAPHVADLAPTQQQTRT